MPKKAQETVKETKTIELTKDGEVVTSIEVAHEQLGQKLHLAKLQAEIEARKHGGEWAAREYREPVPDVVEDEAAVDDETT